MENGQWDVNVATEGTYRIALRRWPREAGGTLRSNLSSAGKALPIRKARLRVGEFDETHTVGDDDKEAVFEVALKVGRVIIESWFYDDQGKDLGGANHAYVEKAPR